LSRLFPLVPLTAVCLFVSTPAPAIAGEKPNIIVIMADDVGYEGFSIHGSQTYKTPHLDKIARNGMWFRHCYSMPICTPSRVQIMTGRYSFRNYTSFGVLLKGEQTFANQLQSGGYRTAIAGKWQLGGDMQTVREFGFDTHCLWHLDGRESRYWAPRISQDGKLRDVANRYGPDVMVEFLCDFIDQNHTQPFMIYYPMMLPHWPFVPTPDSPLGGNRERSGDYDGKNGGVEYFDDMVAYVDKIVGQLDAKLAEHGIRDNTLILFTGDNGCATNIVSQMPSGPIKGGKASMPDNGTHVAMFAQWPAVIKAGQVSNALVDFTDVLPTVLEACGADLPNRQVDGKSLLPVLRGEVESVRDWVFCYYNPRPPARPKNEAKVKELLTKAGKSTQQKKLGRFARDKAYKLYGDGRFYHVAADPVEANDLARADLGQTAAAAKGRLQDVLSTFPKMRPFRQTFSNP
jgi:arylsulfatase A